MFGSNTMGHKNNLISLNQSSVREEGQIRVKPVSDLTGRWHPSLHCPSPFLEWCLQDICLTVSPCDHPVTLWNPPKLFYSFHLSGSSVTASWKEAYNTGTQGSSVLMLFPSAPCRLKVCLGGPLSIPTAPTVWTKAAGDMGRAVEPSATPF